MKQHTKHFAGVWLDNHHAILISPDENQEFTINNKIMATDSQSGGNEHTINNGKKTEHAKYFKEVSAALLPFDEIMIFGPGQSQEQLQKHLGEDVQFNKKKITIDSSDKMSDPQLIALVKDFFKGRQS